MKLLSKRVILSTYNAVYDPLGMLAPFVIRAKILFQGLCRECRGWDETLDDETANKWRVWLSELEFLADFSIPRCYSPTPLTGDTRTDLHVFADASQLADGVACYLRYAQPDE